jgi:hypothetical protein
MPQTASAGKWVPPRTFGDIFREELETLLPGLQLPNLAPSPRDPGRPDDEAPVAPAPKPIADVLDGLPESGDLAAICLSGGGIRSASFGLGVLQGLARCRWLENFHYLSSVSGGGYIASWFSAWRRVQDDRDVMAGLTENEDQGSEPSQIRGIRQYSNYITPELGLFSADTWAVLAIYVRNLLLNWFMFLPFFTGCLLFPQWCVQALKSARQSGNHDSGPWLLAGCVLLTIALSCAVCGRFKREGRWLSRDRFLLLVLFPIVLSAAAFTIAAAFGGLYRVLGSHPGDRSEQLLVGAVAGTLLYAVAWLIGRVSAWKWEDKILFDDLGCWILSGAVVGLVIAAGMYVVSWHGWQEERITILGLSGIVLAYLGGDIFYVGAASFSRRGEMDREWLARAAAWLGASAALWGLGSALAVYGPFWLEDWRAALSLALGGGLSGIVTLFLGPSALTAATQAGAVLERIPFTRIVSVAAALFAGVLAILIASLGALVVGRVTGCDPASVVWVEPVIILILIVGSFGISYFVNVNRFSLHALYRNRLVRAYLGSARIPDNRKPDPFTRFDELDNPSMARVSPKTGANANRLFHVINATLNTVSTTNMAWQERKAESFTITREHCGNSFVGYQPTKDYGDPIGGISLGTAMAISGAAVSPNQGYNSSPLVGFLLMLFNVRLGWWLGNPCRKKCFRDGPRLGMTPALKEFVGATTDQGHWIYLSDGGHFDNLGLYEMVRRRCRFIVVIDAGCDTEGKLEDLSNAVRKIYIDFGVTIKFNSFAIRARKNPPVPGARCATASIIYPKTPGTLRDAPEPRPGWLLYIKPTFYDTTEGVDVRGYAYQHPDFPHESTTDQWFSESQLEAYRALAARIVAEVCHPLGGAGGALTLGTMRETVERNMQRAD